MSQIISYRDNTEKKYYEVSTDSPLPVTAIGGGTGGAEEVEVTQPLPAGTNNIGKVDVASLPATPAGTNTIGKVDVTGSGGDAITQAGNADGLTATLIGLLANVRLQGFNGTTWDRLKAESGVLQVNTAVANIDGTALANAARTATINSPDQTNSYGKGATIVLDVTATSASPSVTLKIQGKDTASGKYYDILTSSAVTVISTTVFKIHPGLTAAANSIANDILPLTWRVVVEHSNTDSIQYSVGFSIV